MSIELDRVKAWIATYRANSPYAESDRLGMSYESAPILLQDLEALVEVAEASEREQEARGIRRAAGRLQTMQNGGGSGKALVWGLLDWADEVAHGTAPEEPKPKGALDRIAAKLIDAEALGTPHIILTYEDGNALFWAADGQKIPDGPVEYGVIGPTGRIVNNGDYQQGQTHYRTKAGPWREISKS